MTHRYGQMDTRPGEPVEPTGMGGEAVGGVTSRTPGHDSPPARSGVAGGGGGGDGEGGGGAGAGGAGGGSGRACSSSLACVRGGARGGGACGGVPAVRGGRTLGSRPPRHRLELVA